MKKSIIKFAATAAIGLGLSLGVSGVQAQSPIVINAVGTWGNLQNFKKFEGPFWREQVSKKTDGAIVGQIKPLTELGLKGFEVMRLLKIGVYDYVYGLFTYVASEDAVFEGVDLSSIIQDMPTQRKVADAYFETLDKAFAKYYKAKLLQIYTFPSQMLFCKPSVASIGDLKGKKIRVYSTTLGDFVEGVGGTSVTVPFAEVVPALDKGVADCGITGTMPAYAAKWYQVATHMYSMRVGMGVSFGAISLKKWNSLGPENQKKLKAALDQMTNDMWDFNKTLDAAAISCLSGGECSYGKAAKMTHIKPSGDDLKARNKIAEEVILARWAKRCGPACTDNWNKTIGPLVGLKAAAK